MKSNHLYALFGIAALLAIAGVLYFDIGTNQQASVFGADVDGISPVNSSVPTTPEN